MCIPTVIDKNVIGEFLDESKKPELNDWIARGDGIVVYSESGGYWDEVSGSSRMIELLQEYRRANRARLIASEEVRTVERSLEDICTRSGKKDKPILALSMAARALLLFSYDKKLQQDFLDINILPKVGRQTRKVYPSDQERTKRRRFLNRNRCRELSC